MIRLFLIALLICGFIPCMALQISGDSSTIATSKKKLICTATTRVHTMGLFMYMGRIVNHNPAADIFFNVTTANGWGLTMFKATDVNDIRSGNNFAFAFVSKTFRFGNRFTTAPYAGVGLEQQHAFAGHGSDVMFQLQSSFRINKKLVVDHIAILNNVVFETDFADWTNRVRLLYSHGHLDITGYLWHNNKLIDAATYTSTGVSVFYNRLPVAKRLWLGAGLTTLATVQSSDKEKLPTQTGVQFTTSLTFK